MRWPAADSGAAAPVTLRDQYSGCRLRARGERDADVAEVRARPGVRG